MKTHHIIWMTKENAEQLLVIRKNADAEKKRFRALKICILYDIYYRERNLRQRDIRQYGSFFALDNFRISEFDRRTYSGILASLKQGMPAKTLFADKETFGRDIENIPCGEWGLGYFSKQEAQDTCLLVTVDWDTHEVTCSLNKPAIEFRKALEQEKPLEGGTGGRGALSQQFDVLLALGIDWQRLKYSLNKETLKALNPLGGDNEAIA